MRIRFDRAQKYKFRAIAAVKTAKSAATAAYEPVIGLETHLQLTTKSKMFCACSANYRHAEPNTLTCPVCLGLPGALPVPNKKAVEYTIMLGLALGCKIAPVTNFDRKNYIYPDLMKGYQISQDAYPICYGGALTLTDEARTTIEINRVHMEEDVAKMTHHGDHSLLDVNRSGVPLVEVVTEPSFRTPEQVELYIKSLQHIVRYLGIGRAQMEEGSFRCDANISVRAVGTSEFGTKVEIKNMNRIHAVSRAIKYEIGRQTRAIAAGERIRQETRGWDEKEHKTVLQRVKEEATDYRYFAEPDIPPFNVTKEQVEAIRANLPELPEARKARLISEWQLSDYDAGLIAESIDIADFFDAVVASMDIADQNQHHEFGKDVANWLTREAANLKKEYGAEHFPQLGISPKSFAATVDKFRRGELNNFATQRILRELVNSDEQPDQIIKKLGLTQISDEGELERMVREVLDANPKAAEDYKSGKKEAAGFIIGQVMKLTEKKAAPRLVRELVDKMLQNG